MFFLDLVASVSENILSLCSSTQKYFSLPLQVCHTIGRVTFAFFKIKYE